MSNARTLASLTDGSNIVVPSGFGLDFSANASASGMTSEVLDDYEEGTWTPAFSASGTTFDVEDSYGVFVKVGNLVTLHAYINVDEYTTSATHPSFYISNLPFTVFNNNARGGADTVNCQSGVTFTNYVTFEPIGGTVVGYFENNRSGAGRFDMTSSNFASSGFAVRFSVTYRSAT